MFRNRSVEAARQKGREQAERYSPQLDFSLPDRIRLDRYGRALANTVPTIVQHLPSAEEARETLMTTAQRVREGVQGSLQDVNVPGRRRRRRGPRKLVLLLVIAGSVVCAFMLVKKLTSHSDVEEDDWSSEPVNREWPETPSTGNTGQPHESDAEAERDAEESAAILSQGGGNGAQATS